MHPIPFSTKTKLALASAINDRLRNVRFSQLGNETNYTPAMIQELRGFTYRDDNCVVRIDGAVVDQYTTEPWAGADFSVVTIIQQARKPEVRKATIGQSKRHRFESLSEVKLKQILTQIEKKSPRDLTEMERLVKQIQDMRRLTPHPKLLEVPSRNGDVPNVVSAAGLIEGRRLQHQDFGNWIATRVLPTFDGDTRPFFANAVLESKLSQLLVLVDKL